MIYFLRNLFDTSDFPARWYCGQWSGGHGWLHILSDLGVWSAYFAIPCVLIYFIWRREDLPFRLIFLLFGAFILLCGLTHLMEAAIFWWPAYRLAGLLKFVTAAVSWVTVFALIRVAPMALSMRSPEELEREITARKKTEQDLHQLNHELEERVAARTAELAAANSALQAEREWYSTTLASIGDGVITTDTEGNIATLNQVAQELTGWSSEEARGKPLTTVFRIVNEKTRQPVENPAIRALREGAIVGLANHTVLIAQDGTERFIDDSAAPIKDKAGRVTGAVLIFRDITEKYQAEVSLRESETRFIQLADAIPQLAWMAGPDGQIDWYNDRWYEYTGTTYEEMQQNGWEKYHDPRLLPQITARWQASLDQGVPFDMVLPLRGADGKFRPFLTRGMPFRDEEGNIVRWFGTNTDVSEQLQIQEELREVAAQLSDADRRKDEFLATLAHELRNPLAPIRTGLEVMRRSEEPAVVEGVLQTMERQTQQLIALVDDLLDVSRITRGTLRLRKRPIELHEVVQSAIEAARPWIEEAKHQFTLHLPDSPVYLSADPHRLAQIFSNLLTNAAKYSPDGGQIHLAAEVERQEVAVRVTDQGIGIPIDQREEIFQMFGQIDHPLPHTDGGLGIGLTLVKSLVEMHAGQIEVQSDGPGQGSTFTVRLPITGAPPTEASETPAPIETPSASPLRVLVVDDNAAAAQLLGMVIEFTGHEVRLAGDGQEGIEVAESFRPQVILMDIGMPKMNGYEAAQHIRRQPWGQGITLIALTGWGQEEDKRRSEQAGFDHHLVKPADPAEVKRLLATIVPD